MAVFSLLYSALVKLRLKLKLGWLTGRNVGKSLRRLYESDCQSSTTETKKENPSIILVQITSRQTTLGSSTSRETREDFISSSTPQTNQVPVATVFLRSDFCLNSSLLFLRRQV